MLNLFDMKFATTLLTWYKKNKRDLPWRHTRDPYKIWISEIIMQQTRIDQGLDYYLKFIRRFPSINSLAEASEHDVLKLWQGLGYYSRARNLHQTATVIANDLIGKFPENYHDLLKLKGIGEYTAAAISSIAFHESRPVVDGNVLRFLARFYGINTPINSHSGKIIITNLALKMIDPKQPGEFNQAMMEFGALFCIPRNPKCTECIFQTGCKAFLKNLVANIPVKIQKLSQRKRYFHYLFITYRNNAVYIKKRAGNDIWRNLYDFPFLEKKENSSLKKMLQDISDYLCIDLMINKKITISKEYRHVLTHQVISAKFVTIPLNNLKQYIDLNLRNGGVWDSVELSCIDGYPVPRLIEKFLKDSQVIND